MARRARRTHSPGVAPVGPQAPPRRPLRLRVDTRYASGGSPPMDYRARSITTSFVEELPENGLTVQITSIQSWTAW